MLACWLCIATPTASSSEPSENYSPQVGRVVNYGITLDYQPTGIESQVLGAQKNVYRLLQRANTVKVSLDTTIGITDRITNRVEIVGTGRHESTILSQPETLIQSTTASSTWGVNTELEIKSGGRSVLEPEYRLSVGYPWTFSSGVDYTLIRDPVVVTGGMHYARDIASKASSLSFQCGTGFVVNENITYSFHVRHSVPLHVGLTQTSIVFGTAYTWGKVSENEMRFHTDFAISGNQMQVGLLTRWQHDGFKLQRKNE